MKKYFLFLFAALAFNTAFSQGYQITLQVPAFKSGISYLTYYMGNNYNIADSAAISNKGLAVFKVQKLPAGVYAIFLPGNRLRAEFLMDKQQVISVVVDTADMINKTIVTGTKDNILYAEYQKFTAIKGKQLEKERTAYNNSLTGADSVLHANNYNNYNKQLTDYREALIKNNPSSMMAALLNAMREPVAPTTVPVTR